jgi:hypothetical protein
MVLADVRRSRDIGECRLAAMVADSPQIIGSASEP